MEIDGKEGPSNDQSLEEPVVDLPPAFRESSSEAEKDDKAQTLPGPKPATPLPSSLENSPEPRPSVKRLTLPSRTPQALRSATRLTANGPKLTPSFSNSTQTPTRTAVLQDPKKSLSPVKPAATPPKSVEKQNGVRSSPRLQSKPRVSYSENGQVSGGPPADPQGPLRGGVGSEDSRTGTQQGSGKKPVVEDTSPVTNSPLRGEDEAAKITSKPSGKKGVSKLHEDDSEITPRPSDKSNKKEGSKFVEEDPEITPKPSGSSSRSIRKASSRIEEHDSEVTPKSRGSAAKSSKKGNVSSKLREEDSEVTPKPSRGTRSNRQGDDSDNAEVQENDDFEISPKPIRAGRSEVKKKTLELQEADSEIPPRQPASKTKIKSKQLKDNSETRSKSSPIEVKSKSRRVVDDDSMIIPKPPTRPKRNAVKEDDDLEITLKRKESRTQEKVASQSTTPKPRIRSTRSQLQDEVRSSPRLQSKTKVIYNEDDLGEQAQQPIIKQDKDISSEDDFDSEPEFEPENEEHPEPAVEMDKRPSKKSKPATKRSEKQPSKPDTSITLNLQKVPVNSGGTKRVNAIDVVSQIVLENLSSAEEGLEAPWAINAFTQYSDLVDQRFCRLVDAIDVNNTLGKAVKRAETKRNNLRLELLQLRKQRTELALEMQRVRDDHQADKTNINRLREISSFVEDLAGLKETANIPSNTQPTESLMTDIVKLDPIINTHYGALERIKALSKRLSEIDKALG